MKTLKINHAAVWVSIVLLHVLGFMWYSPDMLFGAQWMELEGLDMKTIEENQPGASIWIANTIGTILPVYVLAWLFVKLQVESPIRGALIGLVIAFAFVHMTIMTNDLFAQRPYALSWINGGFVMVSLIISGLILGGWRKYSS